MIKDIVKNLSISSTLRINEISKELESEGKEIFKFGFGQSPFEVPENVATELKNNAYQNKYLPIQGLPELRKVIAKFVSSRKKYEYKAENILVGPGTKELMFLLHILFDGEVLLPAPSWVSYEPQAIIGRNKVHWVNTIRENNWFPIAEDIEKIVLKNKNNNYLLFLNSPNNPSGQICKNLKELSEVVKKYNILVLSDEIYSELSFENNYMSISNYCPEQTIISSGLSKWCAAGGWRLGFFAIPSQLKNFKNSLKILCSESFTSVSAPIQYAAVEAYEGNHSKYLNDVKKILSFTGNYAYKNLKSNVINITKPEGGFYLLPEFNNAKFSSSSEMCKDILNKIGVALLPGSDFGLDKSRMIARLSFTDFNGSSFLDNTLGRNKLDNADLKKNAPNIVYGVAALKEWSNAL